MTNVHVITFELATDDKELAERHFAAMKAVAMEIDAEDGRGRITMDIEHDTYEVGEPKAPEPEPYDQDQDQELWSELAKKLSQMMREGSKSCGDPDCEFCEATKARP